jgi:hypothetical protein
MKSVLNWSFCFSVPKGKVVDFKENAKFSAYICLELQLNSGGIWFNPGWIMISEFVLPIV